MKNEKTDRRARYTRMVLKESLIELLKEKRISNISIKEICERADINRSTFYSHYQDQYDLMHQVEQEVLGEIREYLDSYSFDANESESLQLMNRIFQNMLQIILYQELDNYGITFLHNLQKKTKSLYMD